MTVLIVCGLLWFDFCASGGAPDLPADDLLLVDERVLIAAVVPIVFPFDSLARRLGLLLHLLLRSPRSKQCGDACLNAGVGGGAEATLVGRASLASAATTTAATDAAATGTAAGAAARGGILYIFAKARLRLVDGYTQLLSVTEWYIPPKVVYVPVLINSGSPPELAYR